MRKASAPARNRALLAGCAGAVAALGQAPFGLPVIAMTGLALGVWTVARSATVLQSSLAGWAFGFGYFLICLHWIIEPFLVDPVRHGWMAPFAVILLPGGLALFWGMGGALSALWRTPVLRAVGFGLSVAVLEIARGYVLTGFPWALLGSIWLDTPVAQAARVVGLHGLSAITIVAIAASVALWFRLTGFARTLAPVPSLAVALVLFVYGTNLPASVPANDAAPVLRLVQPNAKQHLKWDPDFVQVFYETKLDLTLGATPVDLVIWPETSIAQLLGSAGPVLEQISRFARGAPVVIGARRWRIEGPSNSLAVVSPSGDIAALYDKAHLVPFGEYVPFGDVAARFGISGLAARDGGGFAPGPGPQVLDLGALGKVIPLICYEAIFPQFGRSLTPEADWMVQITNDAWFGRFAGPQQHLAIARFRAIERGLPLVRVANTGISAVIDARGQVVDALPLNKAGAIDVALPPKLDTPPHVRLGDAPTTALLVVIFLSLLALRRKTRD
ncbi:MAG: apolipoprotein N-acyltransferase [Dinoroseobacter sp.]|nr:apolipoprotein N-acyltransferase [Dinoroseobacter sp.]